MASIIEVSVVPNSVWPNALASGEPAKNPRLAPTAHSGQTLFGLNLELLSMEKNFVKKRRFQPLVTRRKLVMGSHFLVRLDLRRSIFRFALFFVACSAAVITRAKDDLPQSETRLPVVRRLSEQFLEKLDRERAALAKKVNPVEVPYPFVRGTFHFHSHFSHDSKGTIEEILAAAKATKTRVIGFTEHKSREVDVVAENVAGWRDGVYFLAGTESSDVLKNELHWPGREGENDLHFLCHQEEIRAFDRSQYDGIEIYNTHSDAKDEPIAMLITAMVTNMGAAQAHPESAFCSFLDYPADFLKRFDQLTVEKRYPGIAGNDSHQNQKLQIAALPSGGIEVLDYTDDVVWSDDGLRAKMLLAAFGQTKKPAERKILTTVQLDPYEISMRHVGTFLQIEEVNEHSVRGALRDGRIILGFELIAPLPSVGFWVGLRENSVGTVGDEIEFKDGMKLHVRLPAAAKIRVVRNGQTFATAESDELVLDLHESGVYRMEAIQVMAGQRYPWVLSNPIYLVAGEK